MNSRGYEGGAVHPGPQETVGPFRQPHAGEARVELSQPLEAKLDRLIGMLSRHDEGWWKNDVQQAPAAAGLAAGAKIFDGVPLKYDLHARSLIIDNLTTYQLLVNGTSRQVPPGALGYVVRCLPAMQRLDISVAAGNAAVPGTVTVIATEEPLQPSGGGTGGGAGGAGPAVALAGITAPVLKNTDGLPDPTTYELGALVQFRSGIGWQRWFAVAAAGPTAASQQVLPVIAPYLYNGLTLDAQRTPNVFKTATATAAGNTSVWTPAAGKKFRLMGFTIEVTETATQAAAGVNDLTLQDSGAAIGLGFSPWIPAAALTAQQAGYLSGQVQLGNGYLSAAANNVLQINLSTALTAGKVRVNAWGTEE